MPDRKVIGYIRVSSEEQAKSGLSLEHQETKIRAYATTYDLPVSGIERDEARSGKNLDRPGVRTILEGVESGQIGHLIIFKLDRLTRSVGDLSRLLDLFKRKDVSLSSVSESLDTSSASGKMVVQMIGVIAEWERDTIAERTLAALSVKRSKGEKLGGIVPYGWKAAKGKLSPNPKEHSVLSGILEARSEGRGYADIAAGLNQMGVKPREGARWYASTIRSICVRAGRNGEVQGHPKGQASNPPGNT